MGLYAKECSIKNGSFKLYFDFKLKRGSHLSFFGPSGSGKSSALLGLSGFLPINNGDLLYCGQSIKGFEPKDRPIDILFQENNLFPHLSVSQNVMLGIGPSAIMTNTNKEIVYNALEKVNLFNERNRLPENISGGQRSRVAIARSLLRKKPILFLDEPFAALDFILKREILSLLIKIAAQENLSIVLVSHDPRDMKFLGGDILTFLSEGRTKYFTKNMFWKKFSSSLEY